MRRTVAAGLALALLGGCTFAPLPGNSLMADQDGVVTFCTPARTEDGSPTDVFAGTHLRNSAASDLHLIDVALVESAGLDVIESWVLPITQDEDGDHISLGSAPFDDEIEAVAPGWVDRLPALDYVLTSDEEVTLALRLRLTGADVGHATGTVVTYRSERSGLTYRETSNIRMILTDDYSACTEDDMDLEAFFAPAPLE